MAKTARQIVAEGVGHKLRAHRKGQRLSQEALARQANMSRETVRAIEAAEGAPEWETLERIAAALKLEFWDLLPERPKARGKKLRGRDSNSQPTGYQSLPIPGVPSYSTIALEMPIDDQAA